MKNSLYLKERLRDLGSFIEHSPVILLKDKGSIWINDKAQRIIAKKKIDKNNLLNWLRIGAQHLRSASYCNIEVSMMRLPASNDILAVLKEKCYPEEKKFKLTKKEKEILECLIKGMTNKQIATRLHISSETVNTHLDSIYSKLGVSNRLAASFIALKSGIVVPKDSDLTENIHTETFNIP